jgi:hypothetical protein
VGFKFKTFSSAAQLLQIAITWSSECKHDDFSTVFVFIHACFLCLSGERDGVEWRETFKQLLKSLSFSGLVVVEYVNAMSFYAYPNFLSCLLYDVVLAGFLVFVFLSQELFPKLNYLLVSFRKRIGSNPWII